MGYWRDLGQGSNFYIVLSNFSLYLSDECDNECSEVCLPVVCAP